MTPENIAELEWLLAVATPGPWRQNEDMVMTGERFRIADCYGLHRVKSAKLDAALIAAAVNALPELLALAKQAERVCVWMIGVHGGYSTACDCRGFTKVIDRYCRHCGGKVEVKS
jgi:hypothetical protein